MEGLIHLRNFSRDKVELLSCYEEGRQNLRNLLIAFRVMFGNLNVILIDSSQKGIWYFEGFSNIDQLWCNSHIDLNDVVLFSPSVESLYLKKQKDRDLQVDTNYSPEVDDEYVINLETRKFNWITVGTQQVFLQQRAIKMDFRPYVSEFLDWINIHHPLFWERGVLIFEATTEEDISYLARFPWLHWITFEDTTTHKYQSVLVPEWEKTVSYRLGKVWVTKEKEKDAAIVKLH